jgi:predicted GNAT family acetyltransferase
MENQGTGSKFKVNEGVSQFELYMNGRMAFLEYYKEGNKIFLTHTEAPPELQGSGAAKELVKKALEYSKENKLTVVPSCSYVAHYVNQHPEWRKILSEGYQM